MTTSQHPLMTVVDVADALGVGERFVRRLVAEHRLPYLKIGAKVRFTREDLDTFTHRSRREVGQTIDPDDLQELLDADPMEFLARR